MKNIPVIITLTMLSTASCKKASVVPLTGPVRTIRYLLYTDIDFSQDTKTIRFALVMKNKSRVLFDSALAPMKINEIPRAPNQLLIERTVPGNDNTDLAVGFLYAIDNVGNSWHLDTCLTGNNFKIVQFAFR